MKYLFAPREIRRFHKDNRHSIFRIRDTGRCHPLYAGELCIYRGLKKIKGRWHVKCILVSTRGVLYFMSATELELIKRI